MSSKALTSKTIEWLLGSNVGLGVGLGGGLVFVAVGGTGVGDDTGVTGCSVWVAVALGLTSVALGRVSSAGGLAKVL